MYETTMKLNVQELKIILTSLQMLELSEENMIAKEFGSVPSLYTKLLIELETLNQSALQQSYDPNASY